jgi:prephenate dehydrogenase
MMDRKTIGILGAGSFGRFLAGLLSHYSKSSIVIFDSQVTEGVIGARHVNSLAELVVQSDILVLCVPLDSYGTVLPQIGEHIRPETLIVDICSVKVRPQELLATHLPAHTNILCTHPLFGPQSVIDNASQGHTLIVTDSKGELAQETEEFLCNRLKLKIAHMSADDHDKTMAQVHALTFFVAHSLREMNLPTPQFMTPSYREVLDLIDLDKRHSSDLYNTIQNGNPYAAGIREEFLATVRRIA